MRKLFYLKALMLSLCMAVSFVLPVNAQRNDNFIGWEENDEFRTSTTLAIWGISNNSFNDTPLGSGLLIMVAAGAGYAVARRRSIKGVKAVNGFKGFNAIIIALALLVGMTQCKKKDVATINPSNDIQISLNIDDGSRLTVNPPYVTFDLNDKILVAYNGYYVGYLTYTKVDEIRAFRGTITIEHSPATQKQLHFYFLGNYYDKDEMMEPGEEPSIGVQDLLSDQTSYPKVLSYGVSEEDFSPSRTNYTAKLDNKCTLVKFTIPGEGTNNVVTLANMPKDLNASFRYNTITAGTGNGNITLYSKSKTEKLAVLFPSLVAKKTTISIDGVNYVITIPAMNENDYINVDVDLSDIDYVFSVGSGSTVNFSSGNLQYRASDGKWQFADNQWTYIGEANANISPSYNGWIDLFGWGTWGNSESAHPYESSTNNEYYSWHADFNSSTELDGYTGWRTLESDEWAYLLGSDAARIGRFGDAIVNDVPGLIILPDNCTIPGSFISGFNNSGGFNNNYSVTEWNDIMKPIGAVFLPVMGNRIGTTVSVYPLGSYNEHGFYWSKTNSDEAKACCLGIFLYTGDDHNRSIMAKEKKIGYFVRLVRDVTPSSK